MTNREIDQRALLLHQDAEIERLKQRVFQLEAIIEFGSHSTLEQYWSLLRRAAEALEGYGQHPDYLESLIAELRKAAQ